MKRLLIITLLAVAVPCAAQIPPVLRPRGLEGESVTFAAFRSKLDSLVYDGAGDVRILHVGGSHVQGGTWSDRLRTRFLALRYGLDGGRGLVFPFAAALTNTPVSYTTSYSGIWESHNCVKADGEDLGLTGIAVEVRDTASRVAVDLARTGGPVLRQSYAFNRVDVLGEGDMEPVLLLQGRDTVYGVKGHQLSHFDLPYYTDWLQVFFKGEGSYTLRGLYLDRTGGGLTYSEAGINGASSSSWARCALWVDDLRRVMPDLVIFSIGINDIQGREFDPRRFKEHYRYLLRQVRDVNPRCAVLFSGINDSYFKGKYVNPHTPDVEQAFRELAAEFDGVFWDMYEVMGGAGSSDTWREAGLMQQDRVHFTPAGYRLIGDLLFDAIMQ
ncbi:MAG: hypothetical protein IJU21_05375 [Bacteroidales bacterium]|nr:hypothetical protein [Bacteroidales bacterium]